MIRRSCFPDVQQGGIMTMTLPVGRVGTPKRSRGRRQTERAYHDGNFIRLSQPFKCLSWVSFANRTGRPPGSGFGARINKWVEPLAGRGSVNVCLHGKAPEPGIGAAGCQAVRSVFSSLPSLLKSPSSIGQCA